MNAAGHGTWPRISILAMIFDTSQIFSYRLGPKQTARIRRPTFLKAVLAPLLVKLSFHFGMRLSNLAANRPGRFATFSNALTTTKSCVTFSNGTTNLTPCWLVSILPRRLLTEFWRRLVTFWTPFAKQPNVGTKLHVSVGKSPSKIGHYMGPTRSLSSRTRKAMSSLMAPSID